MTSIPCRPLELVKNLFFENVVECEHMKKCECWDESSHICNVEHDKRYCGIYRRFAAGDIIEYKKDW